MRELLSALVGQPPARGRPRDVRLELANGDNVDESDAAQPAERLADQVRRLVELGGDFVVRELLVLLKNTRIRVARCKWPITWTRRRRGAMPCGVEPPARRSAIGSSCTRSAAAARESEGRADRSLTLAVVGSRPRRGNGMNHQSYYSTVAQVIPLLFLVIVFELRSVTIEPAKRLRTTILRTLLILGPVLASLVAEYLALDSLRTQADSSWRRALIDSIVIWQIGTIGFAAVGVVMAKVTPRIDAWLAETPGVPTPAPESDEARDER